ncbi:MAG: hypothetical protein L3J49_02715 [Desulfobulbaceae bacterium]|nr:hypothetical protein [Desulfobulbaceae bacterium]
MTSRTGLDEILERLKSVQHELEQEVDKVLDEKRQQFSYQLHRGRVIFKQNVRRWHRQQRTGLLRYLYSAPLAFILSAPVIYGMLVPLVFLDLAVTLYQHVCFRIYGVPRVRRNEYLYIDRHYLPYLNLIEKINCLYCGYGNGLIEYSREVIARTEQFWCPIKHARRTPDPHHRTAKFFDYGDADAWRENLEKVRKDWD